MPRGHASLTDAGGRQRERLSCFKTITVHIAANPAQQLLAAARQGGTIEHRCDALVLGSIGTTWDREENPDVASQTATHAKTAHGCECRRRRPLDRNFGADDPPRDRPRTVSRLSAVLP